MLAALSTAEVPKLQAETTRSVGQASPPMLEAVHKALAETSQRVVPVAVALAPRGGSDAAMVLASI